MIGRLSRESMLFPVHWLLSSYFIYRLLKFMYRTSTATLRIAGLQAIVGLENKKLDNRDLSDTVSRRTKCLTFQQNY